VPPAKDSPCRGEALFTEEARSHELQTSNVRVMIAVKNFSEKISMSHTNWRGQRSWEKNWLMNYK